MPLHSFAASLATPDAIAALRAGLIGEGLEYDTPFGRQRLTYADYTASGRALAQVEDFMREKVLPLYANSHTTTSHCGAFITSLREQARAVIARHLRVEEDCAVIFTGSGATSGINRLVSLCGLHDIRDAARPAAVFIGPYEHHSNILPWRESGAEVVEIAESPRGGPDMAMLERELAARRDRPLLIGAFSAASNVTGILTDAAAVTRLLKAHGALAIWDYAAAAPYVPMSMRPAKDAPIDAIVFSPHKFPGGPGASGVLALRESIVRNPRPTWPGGGSVAYVSPWAHDYLKAVAEREEAGTPNILGDIRAALAVLVKEAAGQDFITARESEMGARARAVWAKNPRLNILGNPDAPRLPIFSFTVSGENGRLVHHQLFARMLSDMTGIQVRGGCVCAGPYGHRLLGVSRAESERIRAAINAGHEIEKPGWARLNFSWLMDDETADRIISDVDALALKAGKLAHLYEPDEAAGCWRPREQGGA